MRSQRHFPHLLGDLYLPELDERYAWRRDYWRANTIYRWHAHDLLSNKETEMLRRRFSQAGMREGCLHLHRVGEPFGPSETWLGTARAERWRARFDTSWRSITIVFSPYRPHTRQAAAAYLVGQGWSPGLVRRVVRAVAPMTIPRGQYPSPSIWILPSRQNVAAACALLEDRHRVMPGSTLTARVRAVCYTCRIRPRALFELASLHRYLVWRGLENLWHGQVRLPRTYLHMAAARVAQLAEELDETGPAATEPIHTTHPVRDHVLRKRVAAALSASPVPAARGPIAPVRGGYRDPAKRQ